MSNETPHTQVPDTDTDTEKHLPTVRSYTPEQAQARNLKIRSAKEQDHRFRRAERVLVFDSDTEDTEAPLVIHLRALTENEEASLTRPMLTENDVQKITAVLLEKTKDDSQNLEGLKPEDLIDVTMDIVSNQHINPFDKLCRRIQMGIVKPTDVTIEWLQRRNPNVLDICNTTLDELHIENDYYIFQLADET